MIARTRWKSTADTDGWGKQPGSLLSTMDLLLYQVNHIWSTKKPALAGFGLLGAENRFEVRRLPLFDNPVLYKGATKPGGHFNATNLLDVRLVPPLRFVH